MKKLFLCGLTMVLLLHSSKIRAQAHTWQWINIQSINDTMCYDPEHPSKVNYEVSHGLPFGPDQWGNHWFGHGYSASSQTMGWLHASDNGIIYASVSSQTGNWTGNGYTRVIFDQPEPTFPVLVDFDLTTISAGGGQSQLYTTQHVSFNVYGINIAMSDNEPDSNLCNGESYTFNYSLSGYPGPYNIVIEKSTSPNGGWTSVSSNTNMPASGSYTITSANYVGGDNYYRVTATSPASNCSRKSQLIRVKVSKAELGDDWFTACVNQDPVLLDIDVTGGIGTCTYSWSPATNLSATNIETPLFTPASAGSHSYTVVITDQMGCQATKVVTVSAAPLTFIHSDAVSTPNPVCQGGTITLSGTYQGGISPIQYTWKDAQGTVLNPGGQQTVTQTITSSPQVYTLTLRDFQNCRVSDAVTVNIDPTLGPQITPITFSPVCPGKEITIAPTVSGNLNATTFEWSTGETTHSIMSAGHATENYTLTVTDANHCYRSATFTVPRDPALSGAISLTALQQPVCYNTDVAVQATITGGTPPFSSGSNPYTIHTTTPNVYASVTDAEGCFSEASLTLNYPSQIKLTRYNPFSPGIADDVDWAMGPVSSTPNQNEVQRRVCPGDLFDFGSHYVSNGGLVSGGEAPYFYHWYAVFQYYLQDNPNEQVMVIDLNETSFPDFQFQTLTDNNMYPFLPPNSRLNWILFYVDIKDANGCNIDPAGPLDGIIEHGYRVFSLLISSGEAELNFNFEQEVCNSKRRGCIYFDPDRLHNLNSEGYEVRVTNLKSGNSFEPALTSSLYLSQCFDFSETGYHVIEVTANGLCGSTSYSKVVYIADIANELEQPIVICNPQSHNLYAQQYIESDINCSPYIAMPPQGSDVEFVAGLYIDMNPGFTSEVHPDFTARIDNCLQKLPVHKSSKLMEQTALDEATQSGFKASILPNPNNGVFMVEIPDRDFSQYSTRIEVYDLVGRKVYTTLVSSSANNIDLSGFNKGMYIVKITSGTKTVVQKVLYR